MDNGFAIEQRNNDNKRKYKRKNNINFVHDSY